jgi:putative membrane protein
MSSAAQLPNSNELAMERTWLAHERTLMAWVRTAASMISFGFTIYKFFQFEANKSGEIRHGIFSPRDFALIMVSIGLISLMAAAIGHRRYVLRMGDAVEGKHSLAGAIAWIVSAFGLVVFFTTLLHD